MYGVSNMYILVMLGYRFLWFDIFDTNTQQCSVMYFPMSLMPMPIAEQWVTAEVSVAALKQS